MEDQIMSVVRFSNQIPSIFDRFLDGNLAGWNNNANTTVPSVNIKETKDGFEVAVAAPGFDKSDFKVELDHDVLTISSEKKTENEVKEGEQYTRREYSYESFKRSFSVPESADGNKINAQYTNGILQISIPKKEEAKPQPKKVIEIN